MGKPTHREHAAILSELKKHARPKPVRSKLETPAPAQNDSYTGSNRPFLRVPVPDRRQIARAWARANKTLEIAAIEAVLDSLLHGDTHEERTMTPLLLKCLPAARRDVRPERVYEWLGQLNGWAEIDSLCQNLFTHEDMAERWPAWQRLLEKLVRDADINRRRASLVLLVGPVHYSDDARFSDLAFKNIERLKGEREILITKAVSWLLRSLVTRHRTMVERYLAANVDGLPKIALRETRTLLKTGTKSGRSQRKR